MSSFIELYFDFLTTLSPIFSASSRLTPLVKEEPLSPIAPDIKEDDSGEAICKLTAEEPADSPAIVILLGSPPKKCIFSLTHFIAILWSKKP